MSKTLFYTHLIEIESVTAEIDKLELSTNERKHLAELVDSAIHHSVLNAIMSELSETDKKAFLYCLQEDDHQKVWQFLLNKTNNIEEKIKKAANELKVELHKDLKEAHKRGQKRI